MGLTWDSKSLDAGLGSLDARAATALNMYAAVGVKKLEAKAKTNAKWTNRTSMARRSLNGTVQHPNEHTIRMQVSHGVEYGVFLELAHEKNFAILWPTVSALMNEMLSGMQGLMDKIGKV